MQCSIENVLSQVYAVTGANLVEREMRKLDQTKKKKQKKDDGTVLRFLFGVLARFSPFLRIIWTTQSNLIDNKSS